MLALVLSGCSASSGGNGTFVGNPTLTARVAEAPTVRILDGELAAPEVLLGDCDEVGDVALGARVVHFDGPVSQEALQIPEGDHCGVFLVVTRFTLRIERGDGEIVGLLAQDFDLWIRTRFEATEGSRHELLLGDEAWLEAVAAAAAPGDNDVDADPELSDLFYSGLDASAVQDPSADPDAGEISGRVDVERYPTAPDGVSTRATGCGAGVGLDLAVPIPPASMFEAGLGGEVGWCGATVTFAADLALRTAWLDDELAGEPYAVAYNGWSQGCDAVHCGVLGSVVGEVFPDRACTVLATCDAESGEAVATGFAW